MSSSGSASTSPSAVAGSAGAADLARVVLAGTAFVVTLLGALTTGFSSGSAVAVRARPARVAGFLVVTEGSSVEVLTARSCACRVRVTFDLTVEVVVAGGSARTRRVPVLDADAVGLLAGASVPTGLALDLEAAVGARTPVRAGAESFAAAAAGLLRVGSLDAAFVIAEVFADGSSADSSWLEG